MMNRLRRKNGRFDINPVATVCMHRNLQKLGVGPTFIYLKKNALVNPRKRNKGKDSKMGTKTKQ